MLSSASPRINGLEASQMTDTQKHNFRLILGRVRGLSKPERENIYLSCRLGPHGVVIAGILSMAQAA
jgi:hypothetical protein